MKRRLSLTFALLIISTSLFAQRSNRVSYINLINRANAPQIFIDDLVLPAADGQVDMSIIFRFDNNFLPYKKVTADDDVKVPEGMNFYTIASLNAEIFNGKTNRGRSNNDVDIAARDRWTDTLFTRTFDETESNELYASGSLTNTLSPGEYNYVLQLSLMESTNERTSQRRNLVIQDWDKKTKGEVIYIKEQKEGVYPLMNLGDNVYFGQDFHLLIRIPEYSDQNEYQVAISRARTTPDDTTKISSVYTSVIQGDQIFTNVLPSLTKGKEPSILFNEAEKGYTYAVVEIPNKSFDNAAYVVEVLKNDRKEPIAESFFRSYWQNMPASLLNLDIAMEHLKFIVNEEQLKQLRSGNAMEKEKKFREFWEKRDPTPNTVYNELMAEYYRRIDYAFKEFSNRGNMAGHESDQGEIYIKFGPPVSKNREFPTNGKVLEIWEYKDRKFIFEATSGFGDFVLLGRETR